MSVKLQRKFYDSEYNLRKINSKFEAIQFDYSYVKYETL